jgi:hypothetical protein
MIDIKILGFPSGPTTTLSSAWCFYVASDLWQLLRSQGYQLDLVSYTEWYQNVKETAKTTSGHAATLSNLLYLLNTVVV